MLMYIKKMALCVAILSLAACASNTSTSMTATEQTAQDASVRDDGYRCKSETVTGSRFPIKRCTTAFQREQEAAEAKEAMNRVTTNTGGIDN
jgi:hypothetical protein